jgi:hypothetical protein
MDLERERQSAAPKHVASIGAIQQGTADNEQPQLLSQNRVEHERAIDHQHKSELKTDITHPLEGGRERHKSEGGSIPSKECVHPWSENPQQRTANAREVSHGPSSDVDRPPHLEVYQNAAMAV